MEYFPQLTFISAFLFNLQINICFVLQQTSISVWSPAENKTDSSVTCLHLRNGSKAKSHVYVLDCLNSLRSPSTFFIGLNLFKEYLYLSFIKYSHTLSDCWYSQLMIQFLPTQSPSGTQKSQLHTYG